MKTAWFLLFVFWICMATQSAAVAPSTDGGSNKNVVQTRLLTVKDGLPTNIVNTGMQDSRGFIWLGTREGLVRYDGRSFVQFTKESCGLRTNNIMRIVQIDDEWLWVLCSELSFDKDGGFVSLFNLNTHQAIPLAGVHPEISEVLIQEIQIYNDTALVLCSKQGQFFSYTPTMGFSDLSINTADPRNFMVAPDGMIWTAHPSSNQNQKGEVKSFDFTGSISERHTFDLQKLNIVGFDKNARPIILAGQARDESSNLMTLKKTGLRDLVFQDKFGSPDFSHDGLQCKLEVENLWFRTNDEGIFRKRPGHLPELILGAAACEQIPNEDWRVAMFTDKSGKRWIVSSEGVFILSVGKDKFTRHLSSEVKAQMIQARGICKDSEGNLYVSAGDFGEYQITPDGNSKVVSHSESFLLSYRDSNRILFGNSRIEEYYPQSGQLNKHNRLGLGYLWCLLKDDDCWWFGGDGGIAQSNTLKGPYVDYTDSIFGSSANYSKAYQIFREGKKLWFVTAGGLHWFDEKTKNTGRIISHFSGKETGWLDALHQVHRDGNKWWIATNGSGLVQWDIDKNTFRQWTTREGLPSNVLYAILEDEDGFLWMSTNFGLVQFQKSTGYIRTFTTEDGLPHHEFNRISWYKDEEGHMYFGGLNGVVSFNPKDFRENRPAYTAPLQVTSLFVYDEGDQELFDETEDLLTSNRIELLPRNSFFNLNFKLLDFENDHKRYAYKLEGLDEEWSYLKDNQLQLGNLPYGEYRLLVKGKNQAGMWSENTLALPLSVISPYYMKWWFILSAVLVTAGIIFGIIRWRTWHLHQERDRLKRLVDKKTGQLMRSLDEKEVLLKEVHHRVKNNLQIISSLLNLEQANENNPHTKGLLTEARHRIKSMALIHQNLYQFNDLSHIVMKDYLEELIRGLDHAYNQNKQQIHYTIEDNSVVLDVDTALPVGLIITELVSNSYKYAFQGLAGGHIQIILNQSPEHFRLLVRDNGVGLPEEMHSLNSTSLGLRLVKLLTKQLKGGVAISSANGTTFTISIPELDDEHSPKANFATADTYS